MVARSATQAPGFSPGDRPRVAIASDGTLAAIHEPARVVVVEVPGCAPFAEVGIDPDAAASEVVWVGAPPRLLVLSRYAAHATVHLVDPYGPRTISEIRLEAPMKLCASVGAHALVVGAPGAAVLAAGESHLAPYQFPARAVPAAAGPAGAQFVVALAGAIEEWDPQSRMPKRRIKLPRPAIITALGGSDRVVWWTSQGDPARIDVWPLVNRGQPKSHDLPEPIAHVVGHPRSDLLVCLGAETGRLYVVDLDGRSGMRVIGPEGIDRVEAAGLVVGRVTGVLAAQAGRPVVMVALDGRDADAPAPPSATLPIARVPAATRPPPPGSTLYGDDDAIDPQAREAPTAVRLSSPPIDPARRPPAGLRGAAEPDLAETVPIVPSPRPAVAPPSDPRRHAAVPEEAKPPSISERFAQWRERMRAAEPRPSPIAPPVAEAAVSWRDELAVWARAIASGATEREPPPAPALDELCARFELPLALRGAVALLYGAHLAGEPGAAPIEVARVCGRRWDDALGKGALAARGVAVYRDSRVRLAPALERALDELPARTGTLVGTPAPIALLGPCVVVASERNAALVAERCLSSLGGALLAAHDHADPRELFLEARARGAVPLVAVSPATIERVPRDEPCVLVVADDAFAEQLGVPRLS
ncbi:MAG TPA: hypothetical protein VLX92_32685 [Kofleriaceae bacterium]|nr:hypothetical protein [Kofleriaceae bacterium]